MASHLGVTVLLVLVVLAFSCPALAADDARLKAEVQALFNQAAAGFQKRDVQAVLATSAPGCTIQYRDGHRQDINQWAKAVAKDLADWRAVKSSFTVRKAWPLGPGKARALYSERHEFTRDSDPGHQYAIAASFEAVLSKTAQGWRFTQFIEKDAKLLRDGKALAPKPKN